MDRTCRIRANVAAGVAPGNRIVQNPHTPLGERLVEVYRLNHFEVMTQGRYDRKVERLDLFNCFIYTELTDILHGSL